MPITDSIDRSFVTGLNNFLHHRAGTLDVNSTNWGDETTEAIRKWLHKIRAKVQKLVKNQHKLDSGPFYRRILGRRVQNRQMGVENDRYSAAISQRPEQCQPANNQTHEQFYCARACQILEQLSQRLNV